MPREKEQSYQFMFCYTSDVAREYSSQIETYLMDSMFAEKKMRVNTPDSHNEGIFKTCQPIRDLGSNESKLNELKLGTGSTTLFLSSTHNWPIQIQNVSSDPHKVINNTNDLTLLKKHNFSVSESHTEDYLKKTIGHGDIYLFTLYIPEYKDTDDLTLYNNVQSKKAKAVYPDGVIDLNDDNIIDTCANSPTMRIGQVIFLVHKSKKIKEYITCINYDDFLMRLGQLD